jgi:hypothetical protein
MNFSEHAPKAVASATPLRTAGNNRLALLALVLPLLMVSALALNGLARRAWSGNKPGKIAGIAIAPGTPEAAAARSATDLCAVLTEAPAGVDAISALSAFSLRRQVNYQEWNVVCNTRWGHYALRVNARTNRVYAVNWLWKQGEDESGVDAAGLPEPVHAGMGLPLSDRMIAPKAWTESVRASRPRALKTVAKYLPLLGLSPAALAPHMTYAEPSVDMENPDDVLWTFTYRFPEADGIGLIKICVNPTTGRLVNYWNPTDAR